MISNTQLGDLIMFFPVVRDIDAEFLAAIQHDGESFAWAANDVVFVDGQACPGLAMLTSGSIALLKCSPSGRRLLLCRIKPGVCCGLNASQLLTNGSFPTQAVAEQDCSGVLLPRGLFVKLVHECAVFRQFIFRLFADQLGVMMDLIDRLAFHKLHGRVAAALLAREYPITVTHRSLADEVGCAREMVSRILKEFEARTIVKLGRRRIYVMDEETLREIAGYR